jgi:hypothetical protein
MPERIVLFVPTVARRLGHAKTSTTLDVYGHLLPGYAARAIESISAALLAQGPLEVELDGLWNAIRAIDWNSLLSAAIGGGFALAGVYFAAARDRINRQHEESYRFRRRAANRVLARAP